MAQDISGLIDLSQLVNGQQADAGDVSTPFNNLIDVVNDILNGAQAFDASLLNGLGSAPSNPASGDGILWYDSALKVLKVLDANGNNRTAIAGVASRNTNQSVADLTTTSVIFDTEDTDTDGMIDLATNNTRITVVTDGFYWLFGQVRFATSAGGSFRRAEFLKNGTDVLYTLLTGFLGAAGTSSFVQVAGPADLVAGDYIELRARHDNGSALNINVSILALIRLG